MKLGLDETPVRKFILILIQTNKIVCNYLDHIVILNKNLTKPEPTPYFLGT